MRPQVPKAPLERATCIENMINNQKYIIQNKNNYAMRLSLNSLLHDQLKLSSILQSRNQDSIIYDMGRQKATP